MVDDVNLGGRNSGRPRSFQFIQHLLAWSTDKTLFLSFLVYQSSVPRQPLAKHRVMIHRSVFQVARRLSTMSTTPVEDAMRIKITAALSPTNLEIHNDSANHAHHAAMAGSVSKETHFRLVITSDAFKSKMQPARHRLVYALLKDELQREGGVHALQLKTQTPEEEARKRDKEGT